MLIGVPAVLNTVTAPPLMLSLSKVATSLPTTKPVPAVPPPVRAAVSVVAKPSAPNPGAELDTERSCAVPVCSVIAPLAGLMVGATPVIVPIAPSSVPTVSPTLMLKGPAPTKEPDVGAAEKLRTVPSTVMLLPATKAWVSELLGAAPDNFLSAVHDALIKNFREELYDHPALAERFEFAEDAKSASFRLRSGVKFHDGTPITPADKGTLARNSGKNG